MVGDQDHEGRRIMRLARAEAQALRTDYIGTEHILLACLGQPGEVLGEVLDRLGVDRAGLRERVLARVPRGCDPIPDGQLPFTASAKRALDASLEAAEGMHHAEIRAGHLFLGVLADDRIASQILRGAGVDAQAVREEVASALSADGQV